MVRNYTNNTGDLSAGRSPVFKTHQLTLHSTDPSIPAGNYSAAPAPIQLFTLKNKKGTEIRVSDCGAAVVAVFTADKNGIFSDVVLGYDEPSRYLTDEYYLGTVVGRYANRIAGDTVMIDDIPYKITVKPGGYHHHGGLVGFNKKIFSAETFQEDNRSGIVFRYTSPDLEEGFPGQLALEVIYALNDLDEWSVEYRAVSTKSTFINLTQHTYFNLSGNPSGSIDDHELTILGSHFLPVNAMQVPTGEIAAVHNTPFDFTRPKKIGKDIMAANPQLVLSRGYDHSFVLEQLHTSLLKHAAVVTEPESGRRLDVYTTEPAIHLYTGNFLNNIEGKNNHIYHQRSGCCLETQHFPDAPNHPDFPSTLLRAGEQFYSKTVFKFSVA